MPNIALLEQVITHIKDNPSQHDQQRWMNMSSSESDCGTAACFAGWACLLSGLQNLSQEVTVWAGSAAGERGDYVTNPNSWRQKAIELLELNDSREGLGPFGWTDPDILFHAHNTRETLELMVKDLSNGDRLNDVWEKTGDIGIFTRRANSE